MWSADAHVDDYLETGGRTADVIGDSGSAVIVGAAVMFAVDRAVMSDSRDSGLRDSPDTNRCGGEIGRVTGAHRGVARQWPAVAARRQR